VARVKKMVAETARKHIKMTQDTNSKSDEAEIFWDALSDFGPEKTKLVQEAERI
jgi:hypothetical protein